MIKRIFIKPWYWIMLMLLMFSSGNLIAAMISGQVIDNNSQPINQCQVSLIPLNQNPNNQSALSTNTNDNGNYSFYNIQSGTYHITAYKEGFFPGGYNDGSNPNFTVVEVDADDQEVIAINIQLVVHPDPHNGVIMGSVTNNENTPGIGVFVGLINPANESEIIEETISCVNYNNNFFINHVDYGTYKVIAFYQYPFELLAISGLINISQQNPVVDSLVLNLNGGTTTGFSISGTVFDLNNNPLSDKFVEIFRINGNNDHPFLHRHAFTNQSGQYSFANLPNDTYMIKVHGGFGMEVYYPGTIDFEEAGTIIIDNQNLQNINITTPNSMYVQLSGTVRDSLSQLPLPNINVAIDLYGAAHNGQNQDSTAFSGFETTTDVNGNYTLNVPFGHYALLAYSSNETYKTQYYNHVNLPFMANIIHAFSDLNNLNFDLSPSNNNSANLVSGTVTIDNDIPGLPVMVVAVSSDEDWEETVIVDQMGHYTIPVLNPGNYYIAVISSLAPPTYYQNSVTWDDAIIVNINGEVNDVNFNIATTQTDGPYNVGGQVDVINAPSSANVSVILKNNAGNVIAFARTNENGEYSINNLPAEPYQIIVTKMGLDTEQESVNIIGNTTLNYTINPTTPIDNPTTHLIKENNITNYPNPFNPNTTIAFELKQKGLVSIDIYNIKGQKVRSLLNEEKAQGQHTVIWNGKDDNNHSTGSGLYFYRMKSGNYTSTGKMILMK